MVIAREPHRALKSKGFDDEQVELILEVIADTVTKIDDDRFTEIEDLAGDKANDFIDFLKLYFGALRIGEKNSADYVDYRYCDAI